MESRVRVLMAVHDIHHVTLVEEWGNEVEWTDKADIRTAELLAVGETCKAVFRLTAGLYIRGNRWHLWVLSLICFWHLRTLSKNRTNERTSVGSADGTLIFASSVPNAEGLLLFPETANLSVSSPVWYNVFNHMTYRITINMSSPVFVAIRGWAHLHLPLPPPPYSPPPPPPPHHKALWFLWTLSAMFTASIADAATGVCVWGGGGGT